MCVMLESNQRVINDVAERSLKLVLSTRIELVMAGYQPTVIPFNYKRILVPQEGIEPPHPDYKTGPLPLRIQGQKLVSLLGFEPRPYGPKPQMQPGNTLER